MEKIQNFNIDGRYSLKLILNEQTPIVETNISPIYYKMSLIKSSGGGYHTSMANNPVYLSINNQTIVDKRIAYDFSTSTPCEIVVAEGTINVVHDEDGSKKMVYAASFTDNDNGRGSASISDSMNLTFIARASEVSASDAYIESTTTIIINRKSDKFTHTLRYECNNMSETIISRTSNQTYGWIIPSKFYQQIPTSKSINVKIYCDTYLNDTLIGTKETTFKAMINEELCKPTILLSKCEDINNKTIALTGSSNKLIAYFSNVKFSVDVFANANASISKCKLSCSDGKSVDITNYTVNNAMTVFNNVEGNIFTATVTDSRGITTTFSKQLSMEPYIKVTANPEVVRVTATGTKAKINLFGNYYVGPTSEKGSWNTLSVMFRYKKTSDPTWSSYTTLPVVQGLGTNYNCYHLENYEINADFDYKTQYDFEFIATDALMSANSKFILKVGQPNHWWNKDKFTHNTDVNCLGQIFMSDFNGILWKEPGFGDKFRIIPYFNGANDSNKLLVQASVGGSGEDPELYDVMSISGKSGNVQIKGDLTVGSFTRNYVDTWMPVLRNGRLEYTERVLPDAVTSSMWPNDQDRLATLRFMSFWNGRYDNDNSNLIYCHQGIIQAFPTTLYENLSGTNGTITLSDNVQYYSCIEIFYCKINDRRKCQSVKVYSPHYTSAALTLSYYTNGFCQLLNTIVDINDNIISFSGNYIGLLNIENNSIVGMSSNSEIVIYKVYGYKH